MARNNQGSSPLTDGAVASVIELAQLLSGLRVTDPTRATAVALYALHVIADSISRPRPAVLS